jgi:hypothetical protein
MRDAQRRPLKVEDQAGCGPPVAGDALVGRDRLLDRAAGEDAGTALQGHEAALGRAVSRGGASQGRCDHETGDRAVRRCHSTSDSPAEAIAHATITRKIAG